MKPEVEILNYKTIDKGALKGSFTLLIQPEGQKILDCKHFITEDKQWFSFPQKEIKFDDGRKSEYIPFVSYVNKEYSNLLKEVVLAVLQKTKGTNGTQNYTTQRQKNPLQASTPVSSEELPF